MKRFLAVFAAALLSAGLWHYYMRPAPPPPAAPPQARPVRKPAPNYVRHIVCPLCKGKRIVESTGRTKVDDCPMCINVHGVPVGYRDVRVLPGYELCANCQGMGLVVTNDSTHPPRVDTCLRCLGKGATQITK